MQKQVDNKIWFLWEEHNERKRHSQDERQGEMQGNKGSKWDYADSDIFWSSKAHTKVVSSQMNCRNLNCRPKQKPQQTEMTMVLSITSWSSIIQILRINHRQLGQVRESTSTILGIERAQYQLVFLFYLVPGPKE
ncbi:MAG: hypothetical protein C0407_06660 [Desulfobacca sp.]|nr:hypothetical protein [Desulfobacca sp.]